MQGAAGDLLYLARRDMAAVLAMFTTLDMGGILELGCTAPASRQPSAASSAACRERQLVRKTQIHNYAPAPTPRGAFIKGATLGTEKDGVHLAK